MAKPKIQTPEWILGGYASEEEYLKIKGLKKKSSGKFYKIRECPKCGSEEVGVLLGREEGRGKGEWECRKCKWAGADIKEKEVGEEEFLKYLNEKREEVA